MNQVQGKKSLKFNLASSKEDMMAEEGKIYVCLICGQEVKVTKAGAGTLVCCGQDMELKEQ